MGKNLVRKPIAAALCLLLLSQDAFSSIHGLGPSSKDPLAGLQHRLGISSRLGEVTEGVLSKRDPEGLPEFILIQDLHANREVQEHIAGIVSRGVQRWHTREVFVEGAARDVETSVLKAVPAARQPRLLADLLHDGLVTGAELAAARSAGWLEGSGRLPLLRLRPLEDESLYWAHLAAYKDAVGKQAPAQAELRRLERWLEQGGTADSPAREQNRLTQRLVGLRLTPEDYAAYLRNRAWTPATATLAPAVSAAETFYRLAKERDEVMWRRLQSTTGPRVAVIGGFHSVGLAERCRAAGRSYVIVTPTVARLDHEQLYRRRMLDVLSLAAFAWMSRPVTRGRAYSARILRERIAPVWRETQVHTRGGMTLPVLVTAAISGALHGGIAGLFLVSAGAALSLGLGWRLRYSRGGWRYVYWAALAGVGVAMLALRGDGSGVAMATMVGPLGGVAGKRYEYIDRKGRRELVLYDRSGSPRRIPVRTDTSKFTAEHDGVRYAVMRHSIRMEQVATKTVVEGKWEGAKGWVWLQMTAGGDATGIQTLPSWARLDGNAEHVRLVDGDGRGVLAAKRQGEFWSWERGDIADLAIEEYLGDNVPKVVPVVEDGEVVPNVLDLELPGGTRRVTLDDELIDALVEMVTITTRSQLENTNMALVGHKSTGKNLAVYLLAGLVKQPVRTISLHQTFSEADLRYRTVVGLNKPGTTEKLNAEYYECGRLGYWLVVDEANKVEEEAVLTTVNTVNQERREGNIVFDPQARFMFLWNPAGGLYTGRTLDRVPDFKRRLSAILFQYPSRKTTTTRLVNAVFGGVRDAQRLNKYRTLTKALVDVMSAINDYADTDEGRSALIPPMDQRQLQRTLITLREYPQLIPYVREILALDYPLESLPETSRAAFETKLAKYFNDAGLNERDFGKRFLTIDDKGEVTDHVKPGRPVVDEKAGVVIFGNKTIGEVRLPLGSMPVSEKYKDFPDTPENNLQLWLLAMDLKLGFHFAVLGETSTGKSTMINHLFEGLLRQPIQRTVQATGKMSGQAVLGHHETEDFHSVFPESDLAKAMGGAIPYYRPEITKAPAEVLAAYNNALEYGFFTMTSQKVASKKQAKPGQLGFVAVFDGNTGAGYHVSAFSAEFASRVRIHVVQSPSKESLVKILRQKEHVMKAANLERDEEWTDLDPEDFTDFAQTFLNLREAKEDSALKDPPSLSAFERLLEDLGRYPSTALDLEEKLLKELVTTERAYEPVIKEKGRPLGRIRLRRGALLYATQQGLPLATAKAVSQALVALHDKRSTSDITNEDIAGLLKTLHEERVTLRDEAAVAAVFKKHLSGFDRGVIAKVVADAKVFEALPVIEEEKQSLRDYLVARPGSGRWLSRLEQALRETLQERMGSEELSKHDVPAIVAQLLSMSISRLPGGLEFAKTVADRAATAASTLVPAVSTPRAVAKANSGKVTIDWSGKPEVRPVQVLLNGKLVPLRDGIGYPGIQSGQRANIGGRLELHPAGTFALLRLTYRADFGSTAIVVVTFRRDPDTGVLSEPTPFNTLGTSLETPVFSPDGKKVLIVCLKAAGSDEIDVTMASFDAALGRKTGSVERLWGFAPPPLAQPLRVAPVWDSNHKGLFVLQPGRLGQVEYNSALKGFDETSFQTIIPLPTTLPKMTWAALQKGRTLLVLKESSTSRATLAVLPRGLSHPSFEKLSAKGELSIVAALGIGTRLRRPASGAPVHQFLSVEELVWPRKSATGSKPLMTPKDAPVLHPVMTSAGPLASGIEFPSVKTGGSSTQMWAPVAYPTHDPNQLLVVDGHKVWQLSLDAAGVWGDPVLCSGIGDALERVLDLHGSDWDIRGLDVAPDGLAATAVVHARAAISRKAVVIRLEDTAHPFLGPAKADVLWSTLERVTSSGLWPSGSTPQLRGRNRTLYAEILQDPAAQTSLWRMRLNPGAALSNEKLILANGAPIPGHPDWEVRLNLEGMPPHVASDESHVLVGATGKGPHEGHFAYFKLDLDKQGRVTGADLVWVIEDPAQPLGDPSEGVPSLKDRPMIKIDSRGTWWFTGGSKEAAFQVEPGAQPSKDASSADAASDSGGHGAKAALSKAWNVLIDDVLSAAAQLKLVPTSVVPAPHPVAAAAPAPPVVQGSGPVWWRVDGRRVPLRRGKWLGADLHQFEPQGALHISRDGTRAHIVSKPDGIPLLLDFIRDPLTGDLSDPKSVDISSLHGTLISVQDLAPGRDRILLRTAASGAEYFERALYDKQRRELGTSVIRTPVGTRLMSWGREDDEFLTVTPTGSKGELVNDQGTVELWESHDPRIRALLGTSGKFASVNPLILQDGRLLAFIKGDDWLSVALIKRDHKTGRVASIESEVSLPNGVPLGLTLLPHEEGFIATFETADGVQFITQPMPGSKRVWLRFDDRLVPLEDGAEIPGMPGRRIAHIRDGLAFSKDGSRAVIRAWVGAQYVLLEFLYDAATGVLSDAKEISTLDEIRPLGAEYSPDGTSLLIRVHTDGGQVDTFHGAYDPSRRESTKSWSRWTNRVMGFDEQGTLISYDSSSQSVSKVVPPGETLWGVADMGKIEVLGKTAWSMLEAPQFLQDGRAVILVSAGAMQAVAVFKRDKTTGVITALEAIHTLPAGHYEGLRMLPSGAEFTIISEDDELHKVLERHPLPQPEKMTPDNNESVARPFPSVAQADWSFIDPRLALRPGEPHIPGEPAGGLQSFGPVRGSKAGVSVTTSGNDLVALKGSTVHYEETSVLLTETEPLTNDSGWILDAIDWYALRPDGRELLVFAMIHTSGAARHYELLSYDFDPATMSLVGKPQRLLDSLVQASGENRDLWTKRFQKRASWGVLGTDLLLGVETPDEKLWITRLGRGTDSDFRFIQTSTPIDVSHALGGANDFEVSPDQSQVLISYPDRPELYVYRMDGDSALELEGTISINSPAKLPNWTAATPTFNFDRDGLLFRAESGSVGEIYEVPVRSPAQKPSTFKRWQDLVRRYPALASHHGLQALFTAALESLDWLRPLTLAAAVPYSLGLDSWAGVIVTLAIGGVISHVVLAQVFAPEHDGRLSAAGRRLGEGLGLVYAIAAAALALSPLVALGAILAGWAIHAAFDLPLLRARSHAERALEARLRRRAA